MRDRRRVQEIPTVNDDRPIHFIGTRIHGSKKMNQYEFYCSTCKADGELGVKPGKTELISCPNHCGALFIQLPALGMFQHPRLVEVTAKSIIKAQLEKEN